MSEPDNEDELLVRTHDAIVVSNFGREVLLEDDSGQRRRAFARKQLPNLVSGDRVKYETLANDEIVVCQLLPRHGILSRPVNGKQKIIASNIDQVVIVNAYKPVFNPGLLDRYLAACEIENLNAIIVYNKIDLPDQYELTHLEQTFAIYRSLGYAVHAISSKQRHGLDAFTRSLAAKENVLLGQSGVGKSSIIKALIPGSAPRVNEISAASEQGRHTTTHSELYHLPADGTIIDAPGVREFALWQVEADVLAQSFREFRPYLQECRFRNCQHINEPHCAVKQAVADGTIHTQRYQSYQAILASF